MYIRYRNNFLSVRIGNALPDEDEEDAKMFFEFNVKEYTDFHGNIETEVMKKLLGGFVNFEC